MKTEEEIIKALGICVDNCKKLLCHVSCKDCPYYHDMLCGVSVKSDALNLIRKQQAEIERLKCETGKLLPKNCPYAMQMEVSNKLETIIRAEAVKEFAERLKEMKYESIEWAHGEHPYVVEESDIDNLVEEMVGDKR